MKRILSLFLTISLMLLSCEDVIEVDAPSEPPRLIVDAVLRIDTSLATTTAKIYISESSSFFGEIQPKSGIQVSMYGADYVPAGPLDSNTLVFQENDPGVYEATKSTEFFSSGSMNLFITNGEDRYLAQTNFIPSVPIDTLVQGDGSLFTDEETEIKITFTDDGNRDDFYIFDFSFNNYLVSEDTFYQGQQFEFSYFYDVQLKTGNQLQISILGADEGFYNYMNQLIVQSGSDQGPFQTPAATVRGNIINVTGIDNIEVFDNVERTDNFALGYFAVVQAFSKSITIE